MDPVHNPDEANDLVGVVRDALTHGRSGSTTSDEDAVRQRAWNLISHLVRSGSEGLNCLQIAYANVLFDNWPDEEKAMIQSLVRLIDHLASQIYFASGAYQQKNPGGEEDLLAIPERMRFSISPISASPVSPITC
jgi:hypothetical protein